ncbi:hypothetical protein EYF80_012636 [Liparis tanakae]|uniref:Uncharacterized protein n=1 Tax=Liparis tanakae TaxID=230148 RepID=A0A4Z2IH89_9TELE|nr:hypothetical protein EYF80_012636 [Liparis tanakae]
MSVEWLLQAPHPALYLFVDDRIDDKERRRGLIIPPGVQTLVVVVVKKKEIAAYSECGAAANRRAERACLIEEHNSLRRCSSLKDEWMRTGESEETRVAVTHGDISATERRILKNDTSLESLEQIESIGTKTVKIDSTVVDVNDKNSTGWLAGIDLAPSELQKGRAYGCLQIKAPHAYCM